MTPYFKDFWCALRAGLHFRKGSQASPRIVDFHCAYQLAQMPAQRIKAGFGNIRQSLLQYADQWAGRALYGAHAFDRQDQFDRSLVVLHAAARDQSQRFEPPDQVARSRLVNGKRPRKLPDLGSGVPGDMGKRPELGAADARAVLDLSIVAADGLDQHPELLEHFQHLRRPGSCNRLPSMIEVLAVFRRHVQRGLIPAVVKGHLPDARVVTAAPPPSSFETGRSRDSAMTDLLDGQLTPQPSPIILTQMYFVA